MKVYDTLTRQLQDFESRKPGEVQMFVCGPTVYDDSHLGHARTYVAFDVIARYLRTAGLKVFYLQNITDIDDKTIARANELGVSARALAERYEAEYHSDMRALGIDSVDKHARATDYIPPILNQIERLIARGYAYVTTEGNVYFDVDRFPDYGKLSGSSTEEVQQHRIEPDPLKKKAYDFSLWKAHKPGEPAWNSPWGKGRPGWHIEDTAITETEFGPQYDLHGGGLDLRFPHHEAEIAQMEAASGKSPLVKYWLHTGFLLVGGQKMSKSLGNFVRMKDGLGLANANVWRLLFLTTHYRSPIDYTQDKLEQAKAAWERIQLALRNADRVLAGTKCPQDASEQHPLTQAVREARANFRSAMEDDFGTPDALAAVFNLVAELNRGIAKLEIARDESDIAAVCLGREAVEELLGSLGFFDLRGTSTNASDLSERLIELLIELRQQARVQKRFQDADAIRARLLDLGVVLEDRKDGSTWRLKE